VPERNAAPIEPRPAKRVAPNKPWGHRIPTMSLIPPSDPVEAFRHTLASLRERVGMGPRMLPVLVAFSSMLQSEELIRHPELQVEVSVPEAQRLRGPHAPARALTGSGAIVIDNV
jgi:hypothetical protein